VDAYEAVVNLLRAFALAVGSAVTFARGPGGRIRVARQIEEHAELGIELFVGATLLNLAINPTLVTATLTIVVRKLVMFSLGLARRQVADYGIKSSPGHGTTGSHVVP
jgi:hypothetical protein